MTLRQRWKHWSRVRRALRKSNGDTIGWPTLHASLEAIRPNIRTGQPRIPLPPQLSINGSSARIRWLYRCWRFGKIHIPEAKAKLIAAGILDGDIDRYVTVDTRSSNPSIEVTWAKTAD